MSPRILLPIIASMLLASGALHAQPQSAAGTAPKMLAVPSQRVGDILFQGGVTPVWLVPGPARPPTVAQQAPTAAPHPQAAHVELVIATPTTPAAPASLSSAQWRVQISQIEKSIEVAKDQLAGARESLVAATNEEARQAHDQFMAAQRRAEDLKRQAEQADVAANAFRPAQVIAAAPVAKVTAPSIVFDLRKTDLSFAGAMARWADESKYTVLWEANNPNVSFEERYAMPLPDAVHKVVRSLRMAGEDLLMCEYSNKVIRVVPTAATCHINRNIQANSADGTSK